MNRSTGRRHVTADLAAAYAAGTLQEADCWPLEKHLELCSDCASRVSAAVTSGDRAPELAALRTAVLTAATGDAAAVACPLPRWVRMREHVTRLRWAAGPALRWPWLCALACVAVAALVVGQLSGSPGARPLLLALAPVLPPAGVALSYGRGMDKAHEIVASTPSGGLRLVLVRTLAVLLVSVPLLTVTGLALPAAPGTPAMTTWLLPGLVLTLAALCLGSCTGYRTAAACVAGAWLTGVAVATRAGLVPGASSAAGGTGAGDVLASFLTRVFSGASAQAGWAAAAVLCAGVLVLRRASFDPLERM